MFSGMLAGVGFRFAVVSSFNFFSDNEVNINSCSSESLYSAYSESSSGASSSC